MITRALLPVNFHVEAARFAQTLVDRVTALGVDVSGYPIDHLCFRTATFTEYRQACSEIAPIADLLAESLVNGRMISTFLFRRPVKWLNRSIPLIEIPAPKAGKPTPNGFEHVEFVVPDLKAFRAKYETLTFDDRGLAKKLNPELELKLGAQAVKFHPLPLDEVIRLEKAGMVD